MKLAVQSKIKHLCELPMAALFLIYFVKSNGLGQIFNIKSTIFVRFKF